MKYLSCSLLSVSLLFLTFGCTSPDEKTQSILQEVLDQEKGQFNQPLDDKSFLMIIPRTGCSTCIGMADQLFKNEHYIPNQVQFVFTRVTSIKTLKIRLGANEVSANNSHIDIYQKFSGPQLDSIYPIIAYLDHGKVIRVEYLTTQTKDLLNDLKGISAN